MYRFAILAALAGAILSAATPARAGGDGSLLGPNSDFPDANLVMPFDARAPRTSFLAASNVGVGEIDALWRFYDASGELLIEVTRTILGEAGTDIVDVTRVADRSFGDGGFEEGPPQSLAGRRGFVVVVGNNEPRLIGNFTIANVDTNSAFGNSAAGFGVVGALNPGATLLGTSFSPESLEDNQLILIGLNEADAVTSLTFGEAPPVGSPLMEVTVELHGNEGDGLVASGTFNVEGSALFTSLQDLFPSATLVGSVTIVTFADEGSGFTGSDFDLDDDDFLSVIGFYGQTVGPFGAGQNLRTLQ